MRGLRFPDDYVIRMFFKEGLNRRPGTVLELGCGSGNNLMLFAAFGWTVIGVDHDEEALENAKHNLSGNCTLIKHDLMAKGLALEDWTFDAIIMPSVGYYLSRSGFVRLLGRCRDATKQGGLFYIRSRLPDDWRWGRGTLEEPGGVRLECRETGEYGLLNVFYSSEELLELISLNFGTLEHLHQLYVKYDNLQSEIVGRNSDVIILGRRSQDGR